MKRHRKRVLPPFGAATYFPLQFSEGENQLTAGKPLPPYVEPVPADRNEPPPYPVSEGENQLLVGQPLPPIIEFVWERPPDADDPPAAPPAPPTDETRP